jgi:hypothetical protein
MRSNDPESPARLARGGGAVPGKFSGVVEIVSLNNWKTDYEQFLQ